MQANKKYKVIYQQGGGMNNLTVVPVQLTPEQEAEASRKKA
jgi:hypothetical protein